MWKVISKSCPEGKRSYTFRATPLIKFYRSCSEAISSHTFCATLSANRCTHALELCVPIRSVQHSRWIAAAMAWNYTFLYVPCNPLSKLTQSCPAITRSYTFCANLLLSVRAPYVPIRSYHVPIRSAYLFKDVVVKLYVPIRSLQQYRRSATRENKMSQFGHFS